MTHLCRTYFEVTDMTVTEGEILDAMFQEIEDKEATAQGPSDADGCIELVGRWLGICD